MGSGEEAKNHSYYVVHLVGEFYSVFQWQSVGLGALKAILH